MDCETLEMPALGRPFNVGMLYDCRADKLVPGITLWDHEKLKQDMTVTVKPNTEFEIVMSESISDKSSSLGVGASLKASFLGGLVSVDGSAKYLNDNRSSKNQARVTLQYKTTTKFKELTMNQLGRGNMKHSYVFDQGIATHVVTAILYGAQAFFVFDREVSDSENIQDIQGNLQVTIKKIPLLSIEGEGALDMEDMEKDKVQNISCKFHGDFRLDQSPVTFEDAVKVYQDLPQLLGPQGERAVPVQVWLLPLTILDSTAAKLVRQISVRLVSEAQSVLEDFNDLEIRCNDVLKSTALKQFPQISKKIKTFMKLCSESKLGLQGTLAKKLPSIRGGAEDEAELSQTLEQRCASPFNSTSLNEWMDLKEREAYTLMSVTNLLTNTNVVPTHSDLYRETSRSKNTVCFVFTSVGSAEPYLSALEKCLKGRSDRSDQRAQDTEEGQWFCCKQLCDQMQLKAKLFSDFSEANKDDRNLRFLAIGLTDKNHKGSTIYLYKDGFKSSENFEPPSKPEAVSVEDVKHNSVTLKFSAPKHGAENVTSYRVQYCVRGETEWNQHTQANASANADANADASAMTKANAVTGLRANSQYSFRVRAITDVGVGPAAEVNIRTLSEPEEPRRFSEEVRKTCELLETNGSLQVYKVPLVKDKLNITGCRLFVYGEDSVKTNRTITLSGASGAGKSTLINSMVNYILGVQWTDPYRFKIVVEDQVSQSQASEVTVYKINYQNGFQIDYSLTIIDTPGFGDRGVDRQILEQVYNLFCSEFVVSDIHALCFVVPSALTRLTPAQRYVFDSVLSVFGEDVAENIRILVTFADGQHPPVLEAIKAEGVPCPVTEDGQPAHHKFNNSALFAQNQTPTGGFDEMFWNMGKANMESFFDALDKTEPKRLTLTKDVLRERQQLEEAVEKVKLDEMKQTVEQIKKHKAEIRRNKEYEIEITVNKPFQVNISGTYATNCQVCHHTCHDPCPCANDGEKNKCKAMDRNGNCTKCPGKCPWTKHCHQTYRWEYKEVTEKRTVEELQEKYLRKTKEKKTVDDLVAKLREEYQNLKDTVGTMVKKATGSINY